MIDFPYTKEAVTPIDCHGREIMVGDEIVILRKEVLIPAKVESMKLKTKTEKITVYRHSGGSSIYTNVNLTDQEREIVLAMVPDGKITNFSIKIKTQYFSLKIQPTKYGSAFSTPDFSKIAVTGRS